MKDFIVKLRNIEDKSSVGGKAYALSRLIQSGVSVPDGICLTTHLFDTAKEESKGYLQMNDEMKEQLNIMLVDSFGENMPLLAIRSSANVEDSSSAAYAGIFESYLNVSGFDNIVDSVKKCWDSVYDDRVAAYTQSNGKQLEHVKMAIVIQEMAQVDIAGVAFSKEPVTGNNDIIYIEGVIGLGERLVSGEDKEDFRWWYNKSDNTVRRSDYFNILPMMKDIGDDLGIALAKEVMQIEKYFGAPQDIEWTWSHQHGISIVQSRPITTSYDTVKNQDKIYLWELPGVPLGGWQEKHYDVFGLWDEYNPRSISPLDWELHFQKIWEVNIDMFGHDDAPRVSQVCVLKNSVPVNIDPVGRVKVYNQTADADTGSLHIDNWEKEVKEWKNTSNRLRGRLNNKTDFNGKELLQLLEDSARAYTHAKCRRIFNMYQWISGIENVSAYIHESLINVFDNQEIEQIVDELGFGIEHETHEMSKRGKVLAQHLKSSNDSSQLLQDFISDYGHFELNGTTISKNEGLLSQNVSQMFSSFDENAGKIKYENAVTTIRQKTNVSDEFWQRIQKMRNWIYIRESTKTQQNYSKPVYEKVLDILAQKLLEKEVITDKVDITMFTLQELKSMFVDSRTPEGIRQIIEKRKALVQWKSQKSWLPQLFLNKEIHADDKEFHGESGSAGQVTAEVKVVKDISEFSKIQQGDIIVTYQTNPAWTQVFSMVSGIIVENGTRLSHAAITAREYSIPCVINIPGITEIMQDGERIKIDGNSGIVSRV